jgi:thiamine kinase-like enzyme
MSQKVTTTTTESTTVLMYENPTSTKTVVEQTGILLDQQQQQTEYCNNAQKILDIHVDTTASIQVCYEQIQQIVETLCPFLLFPYSDNTNSNEEDNKDEAEIDNNNRRFEIKPLTGGLSNKLFLVSNSNFITDTDTTTGTGTAVGTVLVRIHPDNNNATTSNNDTNTNTSEHKENSYESNNFSIVDREQETKFATWLAKQQQRSSTHAVQDDEENDNNNINNMAPTVYGRFINGRVEEFYQNVVPLSCSQMKVYAPWIAQNLASFHQLDTPPKDVLPRPSTNYDATIYESIHGWLKEAKNVDAGSIVDADQDLLKELCEEWEWLEKELTNPPPQYHQSQSKSQSSSSDENNNNNNHIIVKETLEFIRRVVVTHMDCQPLNILIDDNDKNIPPSTSLRLIDFEYYGWNPIVSFFFFSSLLACI